MITANSFMLMKENFNDLLNIWMDMKGLMALKDPRRKGHTVISITGWLKSWLGIEFNRSFSLIMTDWRKRFPPELGDIMFIK